MLTGPGATIRMARKLRKDMSLPERLLWRELRKRPDGHKFASSIRRVRTYWTSFAWEDDLPSKSMAKRTTVATRLDATRIAIFGLRNKTFRRCVLRRAMC